MLYILKGVVPNLLKLFAVVIRKFFGGKFANMKLVFSSVVTCLMCILLKIFSVQNFANQEALIHLWSILPFYAP